MRERNHSRLFFTCALVEQLGRDLKLKLCDVVTVLDVWTMGKVYARLIEDVSGQDDVAETLVAVYTSWIDEKLCDYNSSFYYQPRDYIVECYRTGHVIDA